MKRHVFSWKEKEFKEIKSLASSYPVIAIASPQMFPASLFQQLRKKLKGKAVIRVSKTKVAKKAMVEAGIGSEKFLAEIQHSVALIFTDTNPFELYGFLKKNKGSVAAKPGMIATEDITVTAGDTGIPPGPALSDLKQAGLNVKVQGATIAITEDKVVAKKGEQITPAVASALAKLDLKPIKVGLSIKACYEKGEFFAPEVLNIDEEKVLSQFMLAHANAFNLAFNAQYFTKQNTPLLVAKAFNNAKAVALEANIISPATVESIVAKARARTAALDSLLKENSGDNEQKDN